MIQRLIDRVAPRVPAADVVRATDETVTATVGRGAGPLLSRTEGVSWHLRVHRDGRIGMAGAVDDRLDALVERALDSVAAGPARQLHLPAPAPLPIVRTASPAAQVLGPKDLAALADQLADRLAGSGRVVEAWAERSAGRVDVANTRGVLAGYDVTLVGIGAAVRVNGPEGPRHCEVHHAAVDVPASADLERLVGELDHWLRPAAMARGALPPVMAVGLAPRAVASLLRILEPALSGRARAGRQLSRSPDLSPLRLSPELTVIDDPLVDGRPGSRPIDDDGVASRRLFLIRDGVLRGWRCDLALGERLGIPSTGHSVRTPYAEPQVGPSNTILRPGSADAGDLATLVGDGIVVLDLPAPGGSLGEGRLACGVPRALRVEHGEVTGCLTGLMIRDNLFEMLGRVRGVGRELEWIGAIGAPALVLDAVGVASA
jgi:PmbA protein